MTAPGNGNDTPCDLSIVIVNYNTRELLRDCLQSISGAASPLRLETIVVDNASADDSPRMVREEFPQVLLVESAQNLGFSGGNNLGLRLARGRYLLLLNSDTVVLPGALEGLCAFLEERPEVAAAGPMLLNGDGSLQRSWFNFPTLLKTFCHLTGLTGVIHRMAGVAPLGKLFALFGNPAFLVKEIREPMQVDYLLLAALLVRRELLERIGLLDENLFFYHEDCELGYRTRACALPVYYLPAARIVHLGGSSSGKYPLATYRHYFRSLVYVFSRHEGSLRALLLRLSIVGGMLFRSFFWLCGGYRSIRKVGTYQTGSSPRAANPPAGELLLTYLRIAGDALKPLPAAKAIPTLPPSRSMPV